MLWEADKTTDDQQVYRFFWKLLSGVSETLLENCHFFRINSNRVLQNRNKKDQTYIRFL